jgi:methionyl-tRNA formyltransferase
MSGSFDGLKLVLFSVLGPAYGLLREWAARHQHRIQLVVTTPGPTMRRSTTYRDVVANSPPEQDILITTRMKRLASVIGPLAPDLIVSFTFPYRIPPDVRAIPRLGAINLHPTPLPLYRGPNPMRLFYDGHPVLGATLHRTEEDFDTGVIYSRQVRPMPEDASFESIAPVWFGAMGAALEEGARRAIAGEPGEPQDHTQASYGGRFTEEERWLDWDLPGRLLQARATALNFGGEARALIEGRPYRVQRITPVPGATPAGPAGTVLERDDGLLTIAVAGGAVRVTAVEE